MSLQVFIINRNRLSTTRRMVEWLAPFDVEPVILDNDSTWPPLLAWYRTAPACVIRFNANYGYGVGWDTGILSRVARGDFVLTDSDLDLSGIPNDWERVLRRGLERHAAGKAGFSLEIDDLPDHYRFKRQVVEWESQFWLDPIDGEFYNAAIDTTFALHRREAADAWPGYEAVRAARPYTARHVPWYVDAADLSEEERYYLEHATGSSAWTSQLRSALGPPRPAPAWGRLRHLAPARHRDWQGVLLLFEDGRFLAQHNGDAGARALSGRRLTLNWDRWPPEELEECDGPAPGGGRAFRGGAMEIELGDAPPEEAVPRIERQGCMVITWRESSPDRRENLLAVVRHVRSSFPGLEVRVVEQDERPRLRPDELGAGAHVTFAYNPGPFNRAWGFNVGARASDKSLLYFSDADVVIPAATLEAAARFTAFFDVVKPYERFVALDEARTAAFRAAPAEQSLPDEGPGLPFMLCGGAVLMTRPAFDAVGGWCEEFQGWGGEDNAQESKVSRLARPLRLPGTAYHLHHARTSADGPGQPNYAANVAHLGRIERMGEPQLRAYAADSLGKIGDATRYRR